MGFRPATGHLGGCGGKELCKRSLAVLRPRPPVRVHPPPGPGWDWCLPRCVGSGPQKVVSSVGSRSGAVGLRQQCGASTAPASGRTPNASRSRRRHGSRGRAWTAAACRRCVSSPGGARPSHEMLSPRVEAGALGARASGGPLRAGKRWPSRRLSAGAPVAQGRSEYATAEASAGQRGGGCKLLGGSVPVP